MSEKNTNSLIAGYVIPEMTTILNLSIVKIFCIFTDFTSLDLSIMGRYVAISYDHRFLNFSPIKN